MRLRSIPPMNRRPGLLRQLSSMRAATHIGLVFVGSQSRTTDQSSGGDEFTPRVILPDKDGQAVREAVAAALSDRARYWQEELAQWAAEFPERAARLAEDLGI